MNALDSDETPLFLAILKEFDYCSDSAPEEKLEELLVYFKDKNVDFFKKDNKGWSVVEYYELLHPTIRKTLEQIIPPIDITSPAIDEQVFNAIWRDNLPRLKEYVKAGFDLFDETKDPPFFWTAIRLNHREIIEYFLELGVDVNYQNKRQKTALMHLVEFHTVAPEQIDYLISKGADPFLLDRDYKSLYDYAIDFIKNNTYFGDTIEREQLAEHIKTTVFKGILPPSPRDIEERYKQDFSKTYYSDLLFLKKNSIVLLF